MYENFSSLSLFLTGPMHHKKIHQLYKLMSDYGVNILVGCKTQTYWRLSPTRMIDSAIHLAGASKLGAYVAQM
jgi:hypothetical protein